MSKAVQQHGRAAWGASGSAWPAAKEVVWRRMTGHMTGEEHRCRSRRNSGRCARVGEPVTRDGTLKSPLVQRHVVSICDRTPTALTGSVVQRRVLWRLHQTRSLTAARLSDGCDNPSQRSSHSNRRAEGCTRLYRSDSSHVVDMAATLSFNEN